MRALTYSTDTIIFFLSAKDILLLEVQEIIALQGKVITLPFLLALQIEIDNSKKISVKSVNIAKPFAVMKAGLQHSHLLL